MKFNIIRTTMPKSSVGFDLESGNITIYLSYKKDIIAEFQAANQIIREELNRRRNDNVNLEVRL